MKIDFSKLPFKNRAFSEKPMTFWETEPKQLLSAIMDLIAIETGDRTARENWQKAQVSNLLKHAYERSPFWRSRIDTRKLNNIRLADVPVLTRAEVRQQVKTEGSLLREQDGFMVAPHSTSGSSGTPVEFFVSNMNSEYNSVRSLAQYFMEDRDLSLNRTRFRSSKEKLRNGFRVQTGETWLGPLGNVFRSGIDKTIEQFKPNREKLLQELAQNPIGYLVIQPRLIEVLFQNEDLSFLSECGTKMVTLVTEEADTLLRQRLCSQQILVRSNYSSEELGYIGTECEFFPEHYHVTHSNVIVEVDPDDTISVNSSKLGRVLVTHLHSYATPFIRYDIGDFATLSDGCKCGHNGPTLTNIVGQHKRLLKRQDGSVATFSMKAGNILKIVECEEYRIRQTGVTVIELELGGLDSISPNQADALTKLFKKYAGDEFEIRIRAVPRIDWGQDRKKLGFRSELF